MQNLAEQEPELTKKLVEKILTWYNSIPESPLDKVAGKNNWKWPE